MQQSAREQKRKGKKTYKQLITEAKQAVDEAIVKAQHIILETYVPQLCEALREEQYPKVDIEESDPEDILKAAKSIRTQIYNDCVWWNRNSIDNYLPGWTKDQYMSDLGKAGRNKQLREKAAQKIWAQEDKNASVAEKEFNLLSSVMHDVRIPKIIQDSLKEEEEKQQTDFEMELAPEMRDLGEDGKDTMTIYGEINKPAQDLIKALLQKNTIPGPDEDLIVDYIKPTREMRRSFVNEVKQSSLSLNRLQGTLATLDYILNDMLEIIEEADKQ